MLTAKFRKDFKILKRLKHSIFSLNVYQKNLNVTEISNQISLMFDVNSTDLDMEITKLQNDLHLKTQTFISKYTKDKYPIVTNISLKLMTYFGSTYLAE